MSKLLRLTANLALLLFLSTAQVSAAILLVRDTFGDGTRIDPAAPTYSENGVDSDTDGDVESVWYRTGTGSTASVTPGHFVTTAGPGSSMTMTTYFTPEATPVTLTNIGDSIVVTWRFTPTGVTATGTGNQDMRIALLDSPSASRISTDVSPGNAIYSGYASFMNLRGPTLGNNTPMRTMEWTNPAASAILGTAGNYSLLGTGATAVAGTTAGYVSGTSYTFTMSVTKTAAGADVFQSMVGGSLNGTGILSNLASDTVNIQPLVFDTFVIRPGTPEVTATSFDTTLFQVEFIPAVPEPTLPSLLAGGLVALTALVRRQRLR